jgi:hypothetical protein
MKIRNGFVSNSSSSSFIIGIAAVADVDACKKYLEDNKIKTEGHNAPMLMKLKDIKENKPYDIETITNDTISIESFMYTDVSINIDKLDDEDYVLFYVFYGDEGDYSFMGEDDDSYDYDIDYDIDYDFFGKDEKAVIDMFGDPDASGLNKAECELSLGAGRNG